MIKRGKIAGKFEESLTEILWEFFGNFKEIFLEFWEVFMEIMRNFVNRLWAPLVVSWRNVCKAGYRQFTRCLWDAKNMWDVTRVYVLFHISYAASRNRFLMSRVSNCLVAEAVIMRETKGFSCAIRDKIIVRENNQITKCV